jgi:integrase/recombinase XerC
MKNLTYSEQQKISNTEKLRDLLEFLPAFVRTFFRGIEQTSQPRTRIAYAVDLKSFFDYLKKTDIDMFLSAAKENDKTFSDAINEDKDKDFPVKELNKRLTDPKFLEKIDATMIEEYLEYLQYYVDENGHEQTNSEAGLKRKLSSLRSMFNYFHTHRLINENPTLQVSMPKIHEKNIIRMDANEVAEFLDTVESGNSLTKNQLAFHEKNKVRDLAITTLMLGTGIRVSECVGLDIKDVDLDNDRINIVRKGGNESFVYFGEEVRTALLSYLEQRKKTEAVQGSENALFLSNRKSRMTVRNIEILVKKYAGISVSSKKITPHKLRSTYGTQLYSETGDIYLVADVLGHKDVNTTRRHYAALDEERRRSAKDAVTLRESKT